MTKLATVVATDPNGEPVTAAQAFAAWLQVHEPVLFAKLAMQAANRAPQFGSWTSIIDSIGSGLSSAASYVGSGLSSAASSVGNYLTTGGGLNSLVNLANTYVQGKTATSLVNLQLARANQGLVPAPITYGTTATGASVPVYVGQLPGQIAQAGAGYQPQVTLANGSTGYALTGSQLTALGAPSFLQQYGMPLALAGAALLAAFVLL